MAIPLMTILKYIRDKFISLASQKCTIITLRKIKIETNKQIRDRGSFKVLWIIVKILFTPENFTNT